jgi:regulator of cell morphogenesis and NO signaling
MEDTVRDVVTRHPVLSRIFEELGVDYCCGGDISLAEACQSRKLDPADVLRQLRTSAEPNNAADESDVAEMSMSELCDHIEREHHTYVRKELPRLIALAAKVARVHGTHDPRLLEIRDAFQALAEEISAHMTKEERVLFPMIRGIDESRNGPEAHCGSVANPVRQMDFEHEGHQKWFERLRELSDAYAPPQWACGTFRALFDGLEAFERDIYQHVRKESTILFPHAIAMEAMQG